VTEEELEALFETGLSDVAAGDLVPLPSMPLLAAPPGPDDPSIAQAVEQGHLDQEATGERAEAPAAILDEISKGSAVVLPDGSTGTVTWLDRKKGRVAVGNGRNKTFLSLSQIATVDGRLVAEELTQKKRTQAREEAQPEPEPVKMPASVPRGLFPYQLENVAFIEREGNGIIADEMGLGKQHNIRCRILTPSGWRRIGDLAVGDLVIGSDGKPTRVKGVYPQGIKASYRVRFSDGSSVEAGDEHLWTVAHRKGGKVWEELTLTTAQMRDGAVLERPHPQGGTSQLNLGRTALYLPLLGAPVEFEGGRELPLRGYLLGQLIANGSLAHGTPQLSTNAKDWPEVKAFLLADGAELGGTGSYPGAEEGRSYATSNSTLSAAPSAFPASTSPPLCRSASRCCRG
jgi:preprotein translocase subunit YajC